MDQFLQDAHINEEWVNGWGGSGCIFYEVDKVHNLQNNFQLEQFTIFLFLFHKANDHFKNEDDIR